MQAHTRQHGCTEEVAIAALQANEQVLTQMAAELSIDKDELTSEIHALGDLVNARFDGQGQKLDDLAAQQEQMMDMMKGMSTDGSSLEYATQTLMTMTQMSRQR